MTALENKELKGVTLRLIYTIIISTATIVGTGAAAYFGLKEDIRVVKSQTEVKQIQIDAIKTEINSIQIRLDKMESQVYNYK